MSESVVVVGAGPVGLITALGLAQAGVQVTVLEREPAVNPSPRAMVYHCGVLPGLERLGILDDVEAAGIRGTSLNLGVYATGEWIKQDLTVLEGHVPYAYNIHLGQDKLAGIALEHLRRLPGTEVRFDTAVVALEQDDAGVTLTLESGGATESLRAGWVVGTDGAGSSVRTLAGLGFEGTTWPERFVANNLRYPFEDHGFAMSNLLFDPVHGCIVAKIDDTGLWRVTFCEDDALPIEELPQRVEAWFAEFLPGDEDYELVQTSPYKMHQRSAETYRTGRVLLAGDAAHVTNPTGGLGLTSGLFDSYVLSEALAAVVNGEVGDEVLDLYAEQRRQVFLEYASPRATSFKELVYNCEPAMLEQVLPMLRAAAADEDIQRQSLLISQPAETPSVVTAPTTTAGAS